MKMTNIILMLLAVLTASAQNGSQKIEISVNGKTFEKSNGVISNKNTKPISANKTTTRSGTSHSPEYILEITNSKLYLLNKDVDIKNMFKNILPCDILENCGSERITIDLRINSSGKVEHVTFLVKEGTPLYNMDIKVYSDMEDAIKSKLRFNIPDKSVSMYSFSLPPLRISNVTGERNLFPENLYKERK